jgi:hypothetical protein
LSRAAWLESPLAISAVTTRSTALTAARAATSERDPEDSPSAITAVITPVSGSTFTPTTSCRTRRSAPRALTSATPGPEPGVGTTGRNTGTPLLGVIHRSVSVAPPTETTASAAS